MSEIQVYKKKTVLVKRTGEKIVLDMPFELVDKAMTKDIIKIGSEHVIKTSAINEWYGYNVVDEIEAWVYEEYPACADVLMREVKKRHKEGLRVNKEIVTNMYNQIFLGKKGGETLD